MIPSSDYSNNVPATAEITTTSSSSGNSRVTKINVISDSSATPITINFCNSNNRSKNIVGVNRDTTVTTTTFISAVADKSNSKDNNHCIGDKDTGFDHSNYRLVKRSNSNVKEVKIGGSVAPRFGISPKSVLQGFFDKCEMWFVPLYHSLQSQVAVAQSLNTVLLQILIYRDVEEPMVRNGDVVGVLFLIRSIVSGTCTGGVRKLYIASDSAIIFGAAPPTDWSSAAPIAKPKKLDNRINLNINLSVSITPSLQQKRDSENSSTRSSSSSSDATTIIDKYTSICNMISLSP
ncbi:unnamed protein product [Ilex paraguariensis]|uniref:Uncharacterized protein n=1 Tax=Ilex paraguariensis TaxID=185542 RepID=A0ABC8UXN9_9AQUA